jgi:hypothetical protein
MTPLEARVGRLATVVRVICGQTVTANVVEPEIFVVHAHPRDVTSFTSRGGDLTVEFRDGAKLTIRCFFVGAVVNRDQLVFIDDDKAHLADFSRAGPRREPCH